MASGPYFDKRRGTYSVQWFDGRKWTRARVWKIAGWRKGTAEPKKVPPEALAALAVYAERERAARSRRPIDPGRTVADFLGIYQGVYAQARAAGSARQLTQAVRQFLAWCESRRIVKLADVVPSTCQAFLDHRAGMTSRKTGGTIAPARLNQEKGLLSGAWSRAVKLRELPENPWRHAEAPGWEKHRRRRERRPSWSPEEFEKLLAASRPWLRDILVLGTQTGLRISALLGLEWRDVHWSRDGKGLGEIEVRPELDKVGRGYRVPVSSKAHDLLMRRSLDRRAKTDRVLTGLSGKPTRITTTATGIIRACARAGLPVPKSPNHMMRRSFGRWAILGQLTGRPVPLYQVSRWLGHSDPRTTLIYLDVREEESQDWMAEFGPTDSSAS
jgi:integrase